MTVRSDPVSTRKRYGPLPPTETFTVIRSPRFPIATSSVVVVRSIAVEGTLAGTSETGSEYAAEVVKIMPAASNWAIVIVKGSATAPLGGLLRKGNLRPPLLQAQTDFQPLRTGRQPV